MALSLLPELISSSSTVTFIVVVSESFVKKVQRKRKRIVIPMVSCHIFVFSPLGFQCVGCLVAFLFFFHLWALMEMSVTLFFAFGLPMEMSATWMWHWIEIKFAIVLS